MFEALLFGVVQGVAEWLPVSSEGLTVVLGVNFFGRVDVSELIRLALFLHMGTFLAALVYFRKDVWRLLRALVRYRASSNEDRSLLRFLIIATIASGVIGGILLRSIIAIEDTAFVSGTFITALIGALLLVTAFLLLVKKDFASRNTASLTATDALVVGFVQGFSVLPGLSRSGLTVATLLLRRFNDVSALRVSFLMSLPVVLGANIVLNFSLFTFSPASLLALFASFVLGLLTVHGLLAFARKVNLGIFVLIFGLLMIGALFI